MREDKGDENACQRETHQRLTVSHLWAPRCRPHTIRGNRAGLKRPISHSQSLIKTPRTEYATCAADDGIDCACALHKDT